MKFNFFSQQFAPVVSSSIAFLLAFVKLIIGFLSGSVALLASAMDSLMDMAVSIMNYFAVKFALQPADKEHQFGHGKIEGIAASIEGTVVFLSGLFLIYESIRKIINPEPIKYLDFSIYVMILSIVLTAFLVWYLNKVYKKTNSLIIKGDSIHYKTDLVTNTGILLTLGIVWFTNFIIVDAIVGFVLGLYILKEAYELIQDGIDILLDSSLDEYDDIKSILDEFVKNKIIKSYHCLRTRHMGNNSKYVEFHLVVDPEMTVAQAHEIGDKIEDKIKNLDKSSLWYVNYHQDPHDDSYVNHCF